MANINDEIQLAITNIQVDSGYWNSPCLFRFFSLHDGTEGNLIQFDPQKLSLPADIFVMASFFPILFFTVA